MSTELNKIVDFLLSMLVLQGIQAKWKGKGYKLCLKNIQNQ